MPVNLASPYLQLQIDASTSAWDVLPAAARFPPLLGARLDIVCRPARGRSDLPGAFPPDSLYPPSLVWRAPQVGAPEWIASPQEPPAGCAPFSRVAITFDVEPGGLRARLTFALPSRQPLLLWRLEVENPGAAPVLIERLTLLQVSPLPFMPQASTQAQQIGFFSQGWQSWNDTGVYASGDRFRRTRLGALTAPLRINAGTPHPATPGHFGSDMFGVLGDRATRRGLLIGFLSQRQHFGSLEARLKPLPSGRWGALALWANGDGARLDAGASMVTDWACLHYLDLDEPEPLAPYLDAVARLHNLPDLSAPAPAQTGEGPGQSGIGWCSWYHFYQKVTAGDIRANLQAALALKTSLPIDLIQIDDGFESQVGDWLSAAPGFPEGPAVLAGEIRQAGLTPGLWLAPFIVHPKSRLYADHPDWLLRGRYNRPVNAGFIWDTFTTALDLTVPEALDYARQVVQTATQAWGFSFLKLDFLYAAALPGRRRDATRTRAQALHAGLEALRQAAGPATTLLGCGCPLGPAIGLVDAMRIGADVSPRWKPAYLGTELFFAAEPDMPSARNAAHNALTRVALHQRWWRNDPDCLLLRPTTRLTQAELHTLATVTALTDGALMISDHLPDLPPERLRIAVCLLPLIGKTPRQLDWFDRHTPTRLRLDLSNRLGEWRLLAWFNWDEVERVRLLSLADFDLPLGVYYAHDFWRGDLYRISGGLLTLKPVPAHGVTLLAVRPVIPGCPQYVGSDLHISQGQEVTEWQVGDEELTLRLDRPGRAQGQVILSLPHPPKQARLVESASSQARPVAWQALPDPVMGDEASTGAGGLYQFSVSFNASARLHLIW